jgi:hypothetical protein
VGRRSFWFEGALLLAALLQSRLGVQWCGGVRLAGEVRVVTAEVVDRGIESFAGVFGNAMTELLLLRVFEELPSGVGHRTDEGRTGSLLMLRFAGDDSAEAAAHDLVGDGVPSHDQPLVQDPLRQNIASVRVRRRICEQLCRCLVRRGVLVRIRGHSPVSGTTGEQA